MQQLLAFEAVIRNGSVTAAARDLHLTQSTISRLIKSLEDQLGKALFAREGKRLVPTQSAHAFQSDISNALDIIQRSSMTLVANPGGGVLSLSVLPTFAARWLGPKLGSFLDQYPGIQLNQSTRIQRFNFQSEPFDAAIYFGNGDWPDVNHLKLFDEEFTACASPDFVKKNPIAHPGELANLPLLRLENRPHGWEDWFLAHDCEPSNTSGMVMDQFSMMIQAANSGLGVALLPHYLAKPEIHEKRLVPLFGQAIAGTGAYWLVWPELRSDHVPLQKFRDWISKA